jgi:thiamine kinase-like enzyme
MIKIDFPDTQVIWRVLSDIFQAESMSGVFLSDIIRVPSTHGGTLQAEVVECKFTDDTSLKLFCKYTGDDEYHGKSHKRGVYFESMIYESILSKFHIDSARFYGAAYMPENRCHIMVIEYLEGYHQMSGNDPQHFGLAASTIGKLHRQMASWVPEIVTPYTKEYYQQWLDSNEKLFRGLKEMHPWITDLCHFYADNIDSLVDAPQTLIHGEYYTKNIIIKNNHLFPVDWESAACGAGEIDLASLIDSRSEETVTAAIENYVASRWPDGQYDSSAFEKRLALAKIYFYFRWMADDKVGNIKKWSTSYWIKYCLKDVAKDVGVF